MNRPSPRHPPLASRTAGVLRVRSDVPGASVFLDRKFLGTTPLDVDGLAAGSHRLNVSVDGYEGHAQAIEIGEAPAEVDVRFKDVRLNAAVPVVHKHGVGSCSGQLVADPAGLRYETANREDAFTLRFEDVDIFVVDYLKKNLRVKKRGGRTWNFEDPKGQADPLFVFHRDVEKARARLAATIGRAAGAEEIHGAPARPHRRPAADRRRRSARPGGRLARVPGRGARQPRRGGHRARRC